MAEPNPNVDWYFAKNEAWQAELTRLRALALSLPLTEELKWGVPCYTWRGKNVALLPAFKDYCGVLFVKGALLSDSASLLVQQTATTQAHRQLRFTSLAEVEERAAIVQDYLREAIDVEQAGLKVPLKTSADFDIPAEFQAKLDELPPLQAAFEALTPGRQRAYLLHFGGAKQAATRAARVEKWLPQILAGKGMED